MPPRNAPLPNAVNLFNCDICDKGYPRQIDYENHLRSYDHNHRQRLSDMKKLTASNESDSNRTNKGNQEMRSIPMGDAGKNTGLGPRFKKVGGAGAATGGSRFKKVGVAVGAAKVEEKKDDSNVVTAKDVESKVDDVSRPEVREPVADADPVMQEGGKDEDVVMAEQNEDEKITWEEYDFTKPTGCDHTTCLGCKTMVGGTFEDGWLVMGP